MSISLVLIGLFSLNVFAAGPAPVSVHVRDTDGNYLTFPNAKDKALVLFFADRACPVANKYIPRINEFYADFRKRGVAFAAVYAGREELWPVARHVNDYKIAPPAVIDTDNVLFERFKPKAFSEVAVLDKEMKVVYQGRIDDELSLGLRRPQANTHELQDVLQAVSQNKKVKTKAVAASACPIEIDKPTVDAGLTYTKDIGPIVKNHCNICHRENGTAPFSLGKFEEVSNLAPAIALVLKEDRMPPWSAETDASLFTHTTKLPRAERQKILDWIMSGKARGDGQEEILPKGPTGWTLGKPDYIIDLPEPSKIPAGGRGIFKEFGFDLKNTKDVWVQMVEARPDQVKAVHHITVYTRKKGDENPAEYQNERWGYFSASVPGSGPTVFPKGFAKRVPAGHELMVNIHYTPIGRDVEDHSQIALYLSHDKKPKEIFTDSARSMKFTIPAGERFHTIEAERVFDQDIELRTIVPHAHYRGRSFVVKALTPDKQTTELLSVPKYTLNWQAAYTFKEPVRLPKGTKLQCSVIYDNSDRNPANPDPKVAVQFGPQSDDEMMFCYYDYTAG